jgi:hypothetical protein
MTREERAQGYLSMTKAVSQQFVEALQQDVFPDEETEKVFGIVMNDSANDGIGDMIYRAYSEIYKRRVSHARAETNTRVATYSCVEAVETSVVHQLAEDLASALASVNLAPTFKVLIQQVIDDIDIPYGVYCQQLQARGLNYDFVIHPTSKEHRQWMERLREELGEGGTAGTPQPSAAAAASTAHSAAASSTKVSGICQFCGAAGPMARCSACKEVSYCNQTHQKADWKEHKPCCKGIIADPKSIWIEVTEGEGNGLGNTMMNHIFPRKEDFWKYVKDDAEFAHPITIGPLRSPFSELIGWSVEIYCSKVYNRMDGGRALGQGPLNGAGIYLTSSLQSGLSVNTNLSGRIFVTGRRQSDGKPLTSDVLFGILNFVLDAMDLYEDGEPALPYLKRWAKDYKQGTWEPDGGRGGIDVYNSDTQRLRPNQTLVHEP